MSRGNYFLCILMGLIAVDKETRRRENFDNKRRVHAANCELRQKFGIAY